MKPPSFGTMIRAARLGWGLSKKHGCFVRIVDIDDRVSSIELCPIDKVPTKKTETRHYRAWWDSPDILDLVPWLKGVTAIKKYIAVIVDNDGKILGRLTSAVKPR